MQKLLDYSIILNTLLTNPDSDLTISPDGMKLVAYAPYDKAGDLELYGTGIGNLIHIISGTTSGSILGNNCIPSFSGSESYFENGICSGSATTLSNLGYIFDKTNSFFTTPFSINNFNHTKGIYIDNENTVNDFLKYDIGGLGLNSSSGFTIEMSVKGGALKRSGQDYTLLSLNNGLDLKLFYYYPDTYLVLKNTSFIIKGGNINLFTGSIQDNDFYKIRISFYGNPINKDNTVIKIFDNQNNLIKELITSIGYDNVSYPNNIGIGTSQSNNNQWNDIIDYVKIYKN